MQLSESTAPYSRYVRAKGGLKGVGDRMENGMASAHCLRSRINKACEL